MKRRRTDKERARLLEGLKQDFAWINRAPCRPCRIADPKSKCIAERKHGAEPFKGQCGRTFHYIDGDGT